MPDTDTTPGHVYRHFAQAHLVAAGYEDPVSVVDALYQAILPDDEEYNKEVEQFRVYYQAAMEKAAYLGIIEKSAGNDANRYKELFDLGNTAEGRLAHGGEEYKAAIAMIPEYKPPAREDYFDRFDDLPVELHRSVYEKALQMAQDNLKNSDQPVA